MEFRYRANDDRPPPPHQPLFNPPPSSPFSFFSEQAFRGHLVSGQFRTSDVFFRNPNCMPGAVQWGVEQRIREEIIASEISRRCMVLETQLRAEMMMEREIALRRMVGHESSSSGQRFLPPAVDAKSLEERIGRSLEERLAIRHGGQMGSNLGQDLVPFQRNLGAFRPSEIRYLPDVDKDKVIVMAKPEPSASGVKRKALSPPASAISELIKKKPKEEWSCALCQVSATSERGLNEHLEGKRHKTKEAALLKTKPISQKNGRHNKMGVSSAQVEGKSLQLTKTEESAEQKTQNGEKMEKEYCILPAPTKAGKLVNKPKKLKKFKFWCEMCQNGAYSEVVMNMHKNGKKHLTKLQELGLHGGITNATPTITPLPEVAKEANIIKKETVDDLTDKSSSSSGAVEDAAMPMA